MRENEIGFEELVNSFGRNPHDARIRRAHSYALSGSGRFREIQYATENKRIEPATQLAKLINLACKML
jgi:hypothetical protein